MPLAFGDASFDQVREGNSHYAGGDYGKALDSYENIQFDDDRGDQDKQRQATVMYNRANCLYELDKPDEAVCLYQEAAMISRDPVLINRIRFNLANSYCRQAIAQQQGNLQDAVDTFIKALRIYHDIKKAMPDDPGVRQNITVAAEALRALLEQQRQQEEQEQQQEEEQENLADKIKELLKRQKTLLIESSVLEQVEGSVDPNAATASVGFSSNAIAQSQLSQDTTGLNKDTQGMMAQQLQQAMQQQQPSPPVPLAPSPSALAPEQQKQLETLQVVSTELLASVEDQDEAVLQFQQPNVKDAIIGQARSADHLQSALDALNDPQLQGQNQNKKDQQGENEDQEQQEQQLGKQENQQSDQQEQRGDQRQAKPEQPQEESEDEKMKATEALVRQILQMEKERREEQKIQSRRRRVNVERDW